MRGLDRRSALIAVLAAAAGLAAVPAVSPAANLVSNGDFERPVIGGGWITYNAGDSFRGWTAGDGGVDLADIWSAAHRVQSLDLNATEAGSVTQTLPTIPGHTYTVEFFMAANPDGDQGVKEMTVAWDGVLVDTLSFDSTGKDSADPGWVPHSYEIEATDTSTTLTFTSLTPATAYGPAIDQVIVDSDSNGSIVGEGVIGPPANDFMFDVGTEPDAGTISFDEQGSQKHIVGRVVCATISGNRAFIVYSDLDVHPGIKTVGGTILVYDGAIGDSQKNGRIAKPKLQSFIANGCPVPAGSGKPISSGDIVIDPGVAIE